MKKQAKQGKSDSLSELGRAAQWGATFGPKVFPLGVKSKNPQKGFKWKTGATSNPDTIAQLWTKTPDANIAWRTGEPSGYFVIDVDGYVGNEQLNLLIPLLGGLPETVTIETPGKIDKETGKHKGPGRHLVFEWPDVGGIPDRTGIVPGIDIKSSGGYCVFPPSEHPDGTGQYRFVPGHAFGEIDVAECPKEWRDFIRGDDHAERTERRKAKPNAAKPSPAPSSEEETIHRAGLYLDAMPESISGAGGHNALLNAVNALYWGFGLNADETKGLIGERFNPRCQPPWNEKEIDHKIGQSIKKPPNKERGYLRDEKRDGGFFGSSSTDGDIPDWMKEPPPSHCGTQSEGHNESSESTTSGKDKKAGVSVIPKLINPEHVKSVPINWLWENKIPHEMITVFAGRQGGGKTFWSCYLAAVVTNGWNWADGTPSTRGSALFFYGEDPIDKVLVPRLNAQGADLSKIRILDGFTELRDGKEVGEMELTLKAVEHIRAAIQMTEQETGLPVRLVVVDPISNYWGGIKENDNAQVRQVLKPIQRLAEETQAAFLLITHFGKGAKEESADKVIGSIAITAVARTVWFLYRDKDQKDNRYFVPSKDNVLIDPTGVEFTVNRFAGGRVEIVSTDLEKHADDIEAEQFAQMQDKIRGRGRRSEQIDAAIEWLRNFLADGRKPVGGREAPVAGTVRFEAEQAGHSIRTIDRASAALNIVKRKDCGVSFWSLPNQDEVSQKTDDSPTPYNSGTVGTVGEPIENKEVTEVEFSTVPTVPTVPSAEDSGVVDLFPPEELPEKPPKGPKRHRASKLGKGEAS